MHTHQAFLNYKGFRLFLMATSFWVGCVWEGVYIQVCPPPPPLSGSSDRGWVGPTCLEYIWQDSGGNYRCVEQQKKSLEVYMEKAELWHNQQNGSRLCPSEAGRANTTTHVYNILMCALFCAVWAYVQQRESSTTESVNWLGSLFLRLPQWMTYDKCDKQRSQ